MNGYLVVSAAGFDLAGWVAASCASQGVPVKVTDPEVVRQVWVLLVATESGPRLGRQPDRGPTRRQLEPPDRLYPVGVESAGAGAPGADDGVVQYGSDDGRLSGEGEVRPLSA